MRDWLVILTSGKRVKVEAHCPLSASDITEFHLPGEHVRQVETLPVRAWVDIDLEHGGAMRTAG